MRGLTPKFALKRVKMKKTLILLILLMIPTVAALECKYEVNRNVYGVDGVDITVNLNQSKFFQCPPALKLFFKNMPLPIIPEPYYPMQGGGGGGSYTLEEIIEKPILNESCFNKCEECYEEGSDIWYDCMHESIEDNIAKSKRNLKWAMAIFALAGLVFIIGKIKERKNKKNKANTPNSTFEN